MMEKLRVVKSAEEIAALDKAAKLGDLMLAACRDTARPGVKECEVYADMMQTMLANGGEEPTLFLWASDKHPYPHPFRVPTTRPLEKGDMIICEMHPKFGGYFTHVERTFCLGEPEPRYLDIYDACLAAYRKGLELFKPGAKISTAMDAVRDVITGSGFGICEAGIHGHGLASLEYPRYRHHALRADEGALKAIGDRIPHRHGVRHEHRPVRSEVAQRRRPAACSPRPSSSPTTARDGCIRSRPTSSSCRFSGAHEKRNEDLMVKLPEGAPKLEEILVDTAQDAVAGEVAEGHLRKNAVAQRGHRRLDRHDQIRQGRGHSAAALPFVQPVHDLPVRPLRIHRDRRDADRGQLLLQSRRATCTGPRSRTRTPS